MEIHVISATVMLGLLVFRLLWGFTGSHTSRFSTFIPGFGSLQAYLRGRAADDFYPGHTPIGAISVVALLLCLIFQLLTGLVADDEIYITGPLRDYVSDEFSSWATGKHALISDILLGLVSLHLAAILFYWIVKKNNLVLPMFSGYKISPLNSYLTENQYQFARYNKLIAVIVIALSMATAYWVFHKM